MLKALINKLGINLEKNKLYEVEDIIQGEYKIKIPMKQKNKFRYASVKDSEGELVDECDEINRISNEDIKCLH